MLRPHAGGLHRGSHVLGLPVLPRSADGTGTQARLPRSSRQGVGKKGGCKLAAPGRGLSPGDSLLQTGGRTQVGHPADGTSHAHTECKWGCLEDPPVSALGWGLR